ncbi:MAG: hypothetical protein HZB12_03000 [Candidatus Yonathbacteria bacterium]|nr:hypothetical protein [Candidatus Yonathbacteria bacterium]
MKKVLILGVDCLERQVVIKALLAGNKIRFADSVEAAVSLCRDADVIALGTNHKGAVARFFEEGFRGIIIPILVGKEKGMMVNGKSVIAVQPRELPDIIADILNELERIAA